MNDRSLYRWQVAGVIASLVIVLTVPLYVLKENRARSTRTAEDAGEAAFVGRDNCVECHRGAYDAWLGSDHDRAMDVASDSTVLGDFGDAVFESPQMSARFYRKDGGFFVNTEGPDGKPAEFEVAYVFGVEPLQQYLIPFPGGRLQALSVAWDTERREWFYLYPGRDIPPGDWLHWTRAAQNWNGMCAECHSTNLVKNYDPVSKTFNTTWSEIDVSCEACHGPGSRHVEWAQMPPMARPATDNYDLVIPTAGITSRELVELCAPCHSRRSELGDYDHSRPGMLDNIVPALLEENLYYSDGQIEDEVYVYGSFTQSKMYRNDVRCSDCHDVHSLRLKAEGNALCLQCHQAEVYDSYEHHFHQREFEGRPSDGHLCVKCHMPERPYMVIDWRADHSLRVPRPDLSIETGVPNACNQAGCHDDKTVAWSAEHYRDWYGRARKPHYGTILAAGRRGDPAALVPLVRLVGDDLYPAIVRATALSLLSGYDDEEAAAAFDRATMDEEPLIRYTAINNLRIPDPERFVEVASPLLFDPVRAVRLQAASALAGVPANLLEPYQREARARELEAYVEAMEYSLDFAFAGHNLGNLYVALGEPKKAQEYYKEAIEIDDLFYPAKVNLAMLYNSQGKNAEAERLLREVAAAYPEEYDVDYSLALLLVEMNRPGEALEYLERAAAGMGDRPRVWYNLGLLRQQTGDIPGAEAALTRAVEIEPENLDLLYALADHYARRGLLSRALDIARRMTAADPSNTAARDYEASLERQIRDAGRN